MKAPNQKVIFGASVWFSLLGRGSGVRHRICSSKPIHENERSTRIRLSSMLNSSPWKPVFSNLSTPCLKIHVISQTLLIHLLADVITIWKSTGSNNSSRFILNCSNRIYDSKVFEALSKNNENSFQKNYDFWYKKMSGGFSDF